MSINYISAFNHEFSSRVLPEDALVTSCDPGTVNTKMLLAGIYKYILLNMYIIY